MFFMSSTMIISAFSNKESVYTDSLLEKAEIIIVEDIKNIKDIEKEENKEK